MFEVILLIATFFYTLQIILFTIGANKKFNKLEDEKLPTVSVIIAARNEENKIKSCLESLDKLEYPTNKLQIILVDDNSTDKTARIILDFIEGKDKFKYIKVNSYRGNLRGKANAIDNGIRNSDGEIIITTDADCTVKPTWVKSIASYYTENVGIVCGYTTQKDDKAFYGMQAIDFIYLLTVAAGGMNLGKPLSAIGNNMSFRRVAYDEVGGYEALPFSVTEDFNLLMSIYKLKKYDLIYPLETDALVTSEPCLNIKELYHQKKRWGVGGLKSDFIGYAVMASGFIIHLFYLFIPFVLSFNIIVLLTFKLALDFAFVRSVFKKLNIRLNTYHFVVFEIYFIIYVILLPIVLLFSRKVKWKGRTF